VVGEDDETDTLHLPSPRWYVVNEKDSPADASFLFLAKGNNPPSRDFFSFSGGRVVGLKG